MRSWLVVLALAVAPITWVVAQEADVKKETALPVNSYATAVPGDVATFTVQAQARRPQRSGGLAWTVEKVEGDDVVTRLEAFQGKKKLFTATETFSKKTAPTLEAVTRLLHRATDALFPKFLGGAGAKPFTSATKIETKKGKATELEPHLGKAFLGTKVTFFGTPPETWKGGQFTLWVSDEVKAPLLALTLDYGMAADGPGAYVLLAGYGAKEKTTWGKDRATLEKETAGKDGE